MTEEEKHKLILKYILNYNSFNIDGMLSTLHPDIEFTNISNGEQTANASGITEFMFKKNKISHITDIS